ncbi:MAG: ribonuclease P protein component [Bacteroidales bacterium]|nr:ribonuclease P protein component [Bacteroidales bacterium]
MAAYGFPKSEHLSGKRDIAALLKDGKWGSCGCLKFCWLRREDGPSRLLVSVPKRHFKRAVKRNLLKRRIREAWRLSKPADANPADAHYGIDILIQYNSEEVADFATIRTDLAAILQRLA